MFELFFVVMWLIPILVFVAAVPRLIHHIRLIRRHVNDPEALAAAIHKAVEESENGEAPSSESLVAALSRTVQSDAPPGVQGSPLPEQMGLRPVFTAYRSLDGRI